MKYYNWKRGCAALFSVLALFAALALPASAIAPDYRVSSAYRASVYYQNLLMVPKTGDGAFDTLSVALSQYTYHEGSGTADFDGENKNSSGNFTEYNYAFGKIGGSYSYAWCAAFASWCLQQAGEGGSAGGAFSSCTLWIEELRALGQYRTRASGYTPKMGDLIFFRSAGVARASDHVGLVREVRGGRVYTVEGNSSGQVSLRDYALSDTYIVGYGCPKYKGASLSISRRAQEDTATGVYLVTYDFLNLRAARSATATKKGTLSRGDMIEILDIKQGWGSLVYNGKTVYVSLEYADFVAPARYQVRYVSEGQTVLERSAWSTESLKVSGVVPEREGYAFLYWEDDDGKQYQALDALPRRTLTLTACFEALPPPVEEAPPVEELPPADTAPDEEDSVDIGMDAAPVPPLQVPIIQAPVSGAQGNVLAVRHAGVVSAVLCVVLCFVWVALKRRRKQD